MEEQEKEQTSVSPEEKSCKRKRAARRAGFAIAAVFLAAVAFLAGWFGHFYSIDERMRTFLWGWNVARRNYYRPLDEEKFFEDLYSLLSLDPYSRLFTADEYAEYTDEGEGKNFGVGISLTDEGQTARIFAVTENSPAYFAGLRKGMYVLGYGEDKEELLSGDSSAVVSFIGGREEPFVLLCGYSPEGEDSALYSLCREEYQAAYVHYRDSEKSFCCTYESVGSPLEMQEGDQSLPLDEKSAYIRIDEFNGNAAEEFANCLRIMKERGRKNLILDIRSNGGGYLKTFVEIAGYLLRDAKGSSIVAKAIARSGKEEIYRVTKPDFSNFEEDSRILVLADENTASASECLIGALVDYGTVLPSDIILREDEKGEAHTYGKGIMQSHFPSLSGAAMKLTVAQIVWPSGKSIHGVGVTTEDGASKVKADLIWGESDPMLGEAISRLAGK